MHGYIDECMGDFIKMAGVKLAFYQLVSEGCDRRRDVQY